MEIEKSILNAKYIYLDWNVIKYMKEPRLNMGGVDEEFKDTVFKLKKKYKFPYSFAHIKDRANRYSREYYDKVREDFEFAETVNDTICVGVAKNKMFLVMQPMQSFFDKYLSEPLQKELSIDNNFLFPRNHIDMSKIDKTHPMYEFLRKRNGEMSSECMDEFIQELYSDIFHDNNKYKKLRDYVNNLDFENEMNPNCSFREQPYLDKLLYHLLPFLSSFKDDKVTLLKKWGGIADRWFSFNNKELTRDLLLIQGYSLLDLHPLFRAYSVTPENIDHR